MDVARSPAVNFSSSNKEKNVKRLLREDCVLVVPIGLFIFIGFLGLLAASRTCLGFVYNTWLYPIGKQMELMNCFGSGNLTPFRDQMGDYKHFAMVKFKPETQVADILKGIQDLMGCLADIVKSFEWGEDLESHETGRQGFTHVFAVTFRNKEDYQAYVQHPEHVKFSAVFAEAIDKVAVLDFLGMSIQQSLSLTTTEITPTA